MLKKKIKTRLKDRIYAWDDTPLPAVVGKILTKKRQTLAVAESCTGGLLAARITSCPGASAFLRGAIGGERHDLVFGCLHARGQRLEATVLVKAVKLYLGKHLDVYWGVVKEV